jgi:hypothetical protein
LNDTVDPSYSSFIIANNTPIITLKNIEMFLTIGSIHWNGIDTTGRVNDSTGITFLGNDGSKDYALNCKNGKKSLIFKNRKFLHHEIESDKQFMFPFDNFLPKPLNADKMILTEADLIIVIIYRTFNIKHRQNYRFVVNQRKDGTCYWRPVPLNY